MQRIVVCCDGTWNTADQADGAIPTPTNVARLHALVADADENGTVQHKYYHPGVGTDPGLVSRLVGGGLGLGLNRNIMSAYRSVCDHYETGDDIFLIGFSRGAYTVRSLGGFIGRCGLLDLTGLDDKTIWARIEKLFTDGYRGGDKKLAGKMAKDKVAFHKPPKNEKQIPIRFVGVWDTVGALGIPDHLGVLNLLDDPQDYAFHDTTLGTNVATARHAVALDELRGNFQPTLWTKVKDSRDVQQVWFPGAHSDVGGGYRETGLSDGALKWMLDEAAACGLAIDAKLAKQVRPNHQDVLHDSLDGVFALLPSRPRSAPRLPDGPDLHASARDRHDDPPIIQAPYRSTKRLTRKGASITLPIYAIQPWNDTGLYLEEGVSYEMTATGEWLDKSIACGPDGADDGNFQLGEIAHIFADGIGKLETLFKRLGGSDKTDFQMTRRHETPPQDWPWFALIGAIANGGLNAKFEERPHETKLIGKGRKWTPKLSGYLYAYANDAWNFYDNNRGSVRLTVKRL